MEKVFKLRCNNLVSMNGCEITLSNSIRYLGVHLAVNNVYSCSFSPAKRSFYRSFNAVGRTASEEVIIELLKKTSSNFVFYYLLFTNKVAQF